MTEPKINDKKRIEKAKAKAENGEGEGEKEDDDDYQQCKEAKIFKTKIESFNKLNLLCFIYLVDNIVLKIF